MYSPPFVIFNKRHFLVVVFHISLYLGNIKMNRLIWFWSLVYLLKNSENKQRTQFYIRHSFKIDDLFVMYRRSLNTEQITYTYTVEKYYRHRDGTHILSLIQQIKIRFRSFQSFSSHEQSKIPENIPTLTPTLEWLYARTVLLYNFFLCSLCRFLFPFVIVYIPSQKKI